MSQTRVCYMLLPLLNFACQTIEQCHGDLQKSNTTVLEPSKTRLTMDQ